MLTLLIIIAILWIFGGAFVSIIGTLIIYGALGWLGIQAIDLVALTNDWPWNAIIGWSLALYVLAITFCDEYEDEED